MQKNSNSRFFDLAQRQVYAAFPSGVGYVDFPSACQFLGIAPKTGANLLTIKRLPLPIFRRGVKKVVALGSLIELVERELEEATAFSVGSRQPQAGEQFSQAAEVEGPPAEGRSSNPRGGELWLTFKISSQPNKSAATTSSCASAGQASCTPLLLTAGFFTRGKKWTPSQPVSQQPVNGC